MISCKKGYKYPGEGKEENIRYLINVQTSYRPSSKHFLNGSRTGIFGCFNSLTLSYSSKINGSFYHQRVSSPVKTPVCSQRTMLPIQSGVTTLCR